MILFVIGIKMGDVCDTSTAHVHFMNYGKFMEFRIQNGANQSGNNSRETKVWELLRRSTKENGLESELKKNNA